MTAIAHPISKLLTQNKIRPTYQRIRILEYLHQTGGHPNVDEIFRALSPEIPTLSRGTVYNTLNLFQENNLVHVLDYCSAEARYDITLSNHGHFQCTRCGEIYNFAMRIERLPTQGLDEFNIQERIVFFRGVCPNCQRNDPKELK